MRQLFAQFKEHVVLRTVICLVIGLLVLLFPNEVMNLLIYLLAAYCIVMGIITIVGFFRTHRDGNLLSYDFVVGALLIVLGIVLIALARPILSIISIFLGAIVMLGGVIHFAQALPLLKHSRTQGIVMLALSVLLLLLGALIILNPFSTSIVLFRLFGASLLFMGATELITYFYLRNKRAA